MLKTTCFNFAGGLQHNKKDLPAQVKKLAYPQIQVRELGAACRRVKCDYLNFPVKDVWSVVMRKDSLRARKAFIPKDDLLERAFDLFPAGPLPTIGRAMNLRLIPGSRELTCYEAALWLNREAENLGSAVRQLLYHGYL